MVIVVLTETNHCFKYDIDFWHRDGTRLCDIDYSWDRFFHSFIILCMFQPIRVFFQNSIPLVFTESVIIF